MTKWFEQAWQSCTEAGLLTGTPPMRGALRAESSDIDDAGEVRLLLEEFRGPGWVMFTDRVEDLRVDRPVGEGIVLAAERVDGTQTLHIRRARTGWTAWTIERVDGAGFIIEESLQRIPRGVLHYEVGWTADPDGVFRPHMARLSDVSFKTP